MGLLISLGVFVLASGAVVAVAVFLLRLPQALKRRALDRRVREISVPLDTSAESASLIKRHEEGPLPALDRLMRRTGRGSALGSWIEQSGSTLTVSALLLRAVGLGVAAGLLVDMITDIPLVPLVVGIIAFCIPFMVLQRRRTSRLRKFEEMFPEALDLIARAVRAGHAFSAGLKMAADEVADPVGPEFRKTFEEQNYGLPLKDALTNMAMRIPLLDVKFFATAVLIQRDTGGNLAEILDNLGHVVRERFKILRQVRVHTAHGRLTGYVLLALPPALSLALMFINPDHMSLLFRERVGQMLITVVLIMQTVGYLWIRKIVKIEV